MTILLPRIAQHPLCPYTALKHAFSSGRATLAFQAQIPAELIKRLGDWQSDAYRSYIHIPVKDRMQAVSRLFRFSSLLCFRLGLGRSSLGKFLLNGRDHL